MPGGDERPGRVAEMPGRRSGPLNLDVSGSALPDVFPSPCPYAGPVDNPLELVAECRVAGCPRRYEIPRGDH